MVHTPTKMIKVRLIFIITSFLFEYFSEKNANPSKEATDGTLLSYHRAPPDGIPLLSSMNIPFSFIPFTAYIPPAYPNVAVARDPSAG